MATGSFGYYPDEDGFGFSEVQIRMKVDILTEGPSAGLTFHQTVNAPRPEGTYYNTARPLITSNDISHMLPWNPEEEVLQHEEPPKEIDNKENSPKVRYRNNKSKNPPQNIKLKNNSCSSGSLGSKISLSETTDTNYQLAEEIRICNPKPKPRQSQQKLQDKMGIYQRSAVEEKNDQCTSVEVFQPPPRPRTLPGAVPVLPVGAHFATQGQSLHQLNKPLPEKLLKQHQQNTDRALVGAQDVLINTFEEEAVQSRKAHFNEQQRSVPAYKELQETVIGNGGKPKLIRATEETITTTRMKYEQVQANLNAKYPIRPPHPQPHASKPKMVSAAVQTPKQRVSFGNTSPVLIEEPLPVNLEANFQKSDSKPQSPVNCEPCSAYTIKRNPGIETVIDDPGLTSESTQTVKLEAPGNVGKVRHMIPNPNSTETLIDDPGFVPDYHETEENQCKEFGTLINDPGFTNAEEIKTVDIFTNDDLVTSVEGNVTSISKDLVVESPQQNLGSEIESVGYTKISSPTTVSEHNKISSVKESADVSFQSTDSLEELNISRDTSTPSYADYAVQHKLMPSSKIFELYTSRRSMESCGSPSPGVQSAKSSSPLTPSATLDEKNMQENKLLGQNEKCPMPPQNRSPIPEESLLLELSPALNARQIIYTIQETKTVEQTVRENTVTTANNVLKNSILPHSSPEENPISTCSSRENSLLKQALIKNNPELTPTLHESSSRNSIDSERSSLSGIVKTGGNFSFANKELSSVGEDNLSDYLQGRLSPLAGKQLGSYAESTLSQDSVISEVSIKADGNSEKASRRDEGETKPKVRSFADIMGINLTPSPPISHLHETQNISTQGREDILEKGVSMSSISSYGSFYQDPVQEATVLTRPPFQASTYGHAKTGTVEKFPGAKKISMSPTSL